MAVAYDSTGTTGLTNGSRTVAGGPYTYTHTTVGANALVIAGFSVVGGGSNPYSYYAPTALTCGGVPMQLIGFKGNNNVANATGFCALYACVAPNTGANTISLAVPRTEVCHLQTVAYTGVTGMVYRKVNSGSSTNPTTGAATSAAGDMVVSILGVGAKALSSATQTERWLQSGTSGIQSAGIQDAAGAATVTTAYSANTGAWGTVSVNLHGGATLTVGDNQNGGGVDNGNQNYILATPMTLPVAGTIQSVSLYLGASKDGDLYMGIYDDDGTGGMPGTLLGTTGQILSAALAVNSWNTKNITSPPSLQPGNYWLLVTTNNSGMAFTYTGDGADSPYSARTYAALGNLSLTWSHQVANAFYATYTVPPPPATANFFPMF